MKKRIHPELFAAIEEARGELYSSKVALADLEAGAVFPTLPLRARMAITHEHRQLIQHIARLDNFLYLDLKLAAPQKLKKEL